MTFQPERTVQLPPQLSTIAPEVDGMYYDIYWISVAFTVAIYGAMLWFMWKYRRRPGRKPKPTGHSDALEIFWTFTPLLLLFYLFHAGFDGYVKGIYAPEDSIQIRVKGQQWLWEFEHPGGVIDTPNQLKVPVNQPVELIMSSADVLHSFFIPVFRVKRDVVPGMYTSLWFEATELTGPQACSEDTPCGEGETCYWGSCIATCRSDADCIPTLGENSFCGGRINDEQRTCAYPVFCTEYCGAMHDNPSTNGAFDDPGGMGRNSNHSTMLADLRVITQEGYDAFLELGPPPPAQCTTEDPNCETDECKICWGEQLRSDNACGACHSIDGSSGTAPSWLGIFGNERRFEGGTSAVADAEYIARSIREPQAQIVEGYTQAAMQPFRLSDKQIEALTAYIASLQ